jgi:N-acetylglutamate synthase-like GNAT family acetyltransferase
VDNLKVNVRLAKAADLNAVNQDHYVSDEVILKKIAADEVFLLSIDGEPVGYLRLEYLWSMVPYIALVHISEPFRGQGYSHNLLNFVEDYLREKGFDILYSSSTGNEAEPQAWHRHMGFEECGFIAGMNEGGVGEIFFRKEL